VGKPGCIAQMVEAYNQVGGNIICVQEVPPEKTASYGVIAPGARDGRLTEVKGLVEKPKPEDAPSNLSVVGRYILQPEVMQILDKKETGAGGEIQLTDAMAQLIGRQPFHGLTFEGDRHDCGDKTGFVIANIALAMAREDVAPAVRAYVANIG
ncbi:MAG TPA: sugar phosphate nucleotidyltransferase, partial [Allosphingosinicella sp.]|nr:sugar phosphate nucleotidyltransferase [Allosphingosinicella sp.]